MTPTAPAASRLDRLLGRPAVEAVGRWVTRARLRALAYHGVSDPDAFAAQVEHLVAHYRPVSGAEVADAVTGGGSLPERAVWLTFDDGRPSVVHDALPVLERHGVPATLFVCPGLFPPGSRFWQTDVMAALAVGGAYRFEGREYHDRRLVVALKRAPDSRRREVVDELAVRLDGWRPAREDTVTEDEVRTWLASGREVGNHTWSHPCLDRCSPEEQERQIVDAHEALRGLLGTAPDLFAYPNGDWTPEAEAVLRRLGYRVAPVFDHRVVGRHAEPFRLSRLRIDADAPLPRFRAVLSGAHSGLFHLRSRLGRGAGPTTD